MSKSVLTCLLATTATVWLAVAIAQTIAPNNMLTAAGFVAKYPDTPEKQEIFNSLPPNRLVKRGRNGKVYYVYADPGGCGCAYVGSPNAYANYRNGGFRDVFGVEFGGADGLQPGPGICSRKCRDGAGLCRFF